MKKSIAILFDLDGTLLDTLEDLCDAVNETMRKFSSPERTLDEVRGFVGHGAADLIAKSIVEGRENPDYDRALSFFKTYYAANADVKTHPYVGVTELLTRLKESEIPCAVVTNKPDEASRLLCQRHFGELLADSIGDREGLLRKPAPDKVFDMMKKLGCNKAIFVGDSEADVLTAKNANIPCICMTWGFRSREDMEAVGGSIFCDTAQELEREILKLIRKIENTQEIEK